MENINHLIRKYYTPDEANLTANNKKLALHRGLTKKYMRSH